MTTIEKEFILSKAQDTLENFVRNEKVRQNIRDSIYLTDASEIAYLLREVEVSETAIKIYRRLQTV